MIALSPEAVLHAATPLLPAGHLSGVMVMWAEPVPEEDTAGIAMLIASGVPGAEGEGVWIGDRAWIVTSPAVARPDLTWENVRSAVTRLRASNVHQLVRSSGRVRFRLYLGADIRHDT